MNGYNINEISLNKTKANDFVDIIEADNVSHAYIFECTDMPTAREFAVFIAKLLLCEVESSSKPCGSCSSCLKLSELCHPDVVLLSSSGGRFSFHIEDIRFIRSDAYVMPNDSDKKIYILENAQDMTVQAQNALLKILEEPPKNVYFFILTIRRELLLPTVLSRGQIIKLESPEDKQREVNENAALTLKALLSPLNNRFDFFAFFLSLKLKRDKALELFNDIVELLRDLIIYKESGNSTIYDQTEKLSVLVSAKAIIKMMDSLREAILKIENNANINAVFTLLAYELWSSKSI
ncbi:MAG: hypothetical protein A2Y17_03855 [Clostridiales bacterium GWF2_38_85]|nr:MAG: hypothetical protein A2Y17_03855 [Clostridiales bacterium GWF2_38_85]